jgi:naphtho-gamma-pyrone polyketide synthase
MPVSRQSLTWTFAWDYSRPSAKNLYLGSAKSNVSYGESASGVTALIKVLLMMQNSKFILISVSG